MEVEFICERSGQIVRKYKEGVVGVIFDKYCHTHIIISFEGGSKIFHPIGGYIVRTKP